MEITMSNVEQAVSCFREGFACSQAILSTYGEEFGLDRNTALKIADGFAGGMAGMGRTCGAVVGSIMVIGLKHGRTKASDKQAKAKTVDLVREFVKRFESRNKSTVCKEMLGCEIDTPVKVGMARIKGLFSTVCPKVVRDAAEILEEIL